ncbi:MAG TPA: PQQ-binding-like beta-propeller repeat protein [Bryobacteraceae bacterium]|jgi:outer membrane protein assembly factor BamB
MRTKRIGLIAISIGCAVMPGANWLTDGGSPKRTGWQQNETILTKDNVKDMKLLWKLHLDNAPREMHSLFPPLIAGQIRTGSGMKQIAIEAGSSDNVYAIDVAAGTVLWQKHFPYVSQKPELPGRGPLCPGGLVATPVIGPPNASGPTPVYVASSDGMLHTLSMADGEDLAPPVDFLPPNAKAYSLNLWENVIYSTTAQGCGGNPNKFWAIDLSTPAKSVTSYDPGGRGGLWGRSGAAIGSDGTVYAPTGDGPFDPQKHMLSESLVAVTPKELKLKDYFSPPNAAFLWKRDLDMNVTPVIFDYQGRELLATSSKECRVFLLDSKSLGGADHRTPLYRSPLMCNEEVNFAAAGVWGSMASWRDSNGTRWVLAPFWGPVHPAFKVPVSYGPVEHGAVVAFKVEAQDGKTVLTPAWMSRDLNQAEPPVIADGIVFAYGSGEDNTQVTPAAGLTANTSANRVKGSTHAILYALDGETGKELWSSGKDITSFAHFTGLSVANGRVYLGTYDSNLYSFGLSEK